MESINLNLIPQGANPVVHAKQFDEGRGFRFNLFNGTDPIVLTGAETITCNVKKPDGNLVTVAVTNTSSNYVEVYTTLQMCACYGANLGEIRLEEDGNDIGTLNFTLSVEESPLNNGIESESSIHNLNTMVDGMVAEEVATQYDSANVIFDNEPTENHGIGYTVTSEGIKTAIDNAFDYDNTASGSIVHIEDGADNIPVKSLVSEIVATGGGGTPDSPIAINGFGSGVVSVCGKNLLGGLALGNAIVNAVNNPNASKFDSDVNGNFVTIDAGGSTNNKNFTNGIRIKENTRYTLILRLTRYQTGTNLNSNISFHYTDGTQNTVYFSTTTASEVVTIAQASLEGKTLQYISTSFGGGITRLFYENSGVFEGVLTVDDYEAYNGNNYTFAFGQTVYGGYFNNKGNLVVTHEYIASYNGETINEPWISSMDNYVPNTSPSTGAQVVYPLANPITLSITSQDIPTLSGENNIFSNCGDVEVNYYTSKSNDILEFVDSEIGKKNGTNIPIEENSQDSIKDYIDDEVSSINATNLPISASDTTSTKGYIDIGLSEKADSIDLPFINYQEIDVTFDASGEGTLFNSVKFVVGLKDIPSDQLYVGYVSYIAGSTIKVKALSRTAIAFSSQNNVSSTRKVGVYYLDNIATQ